MKKLLFAALAVLLLLNGCAGQNVRSQVSRELDIDVSGGTVVSSYDTHGWFGDGTLCVALRLEDDTVLEEIRSRGDWKALPLDETARALLYGITYEKDGQLYGIGPYLADENGKPLVPEVENGWYLLIDRQTDRGTELLKRGSFNLTLGLYDADTNTLYFCKLDT